MTESSRKIVNYVIDNKDTSSDAARIYFVHQKGTDEPLVIKVLLPCKNLRYSLFTPKKRRECQIEALRWNRIFTPDVYLGVAPLSPHLQEFDESISLEEIITEPDEAQALNARGKDFALIMHCLPQRQRLDFLLREANEIIRATYIELLTERIVFMHTYLSPVLDNQDWGNLNRLRKKFKHNIHLFENSQREINANNTKNVLYTSYYKNAYDEFNGILNDFYEALSKSTYAWCFKQRVEEGGIRRCHGDLKSTNIWIMPHEYMANQERHKDVKVLDAIDFNGMYSNIDVLSDVAMLAVDIYAIVRDDNCVDKLIKSYLTKTQQQNDDVAWDVLVCYLFEKAVVCAALSIIDEQNPERGQLFLNYAKYWLMQLPRSLKLRSVVNELTKIS